MDGRPDAAPGLRVERRPPGCSSSGSGSPSVVMSSTGMTTSRSSGLRAPASTMVTSRLGPVPPRKRAMVSSGRWVALRPMRCGESAFLGAEVFEPLEAEREMRAALAAGDRVDLVDDHVLDPAKGVAGPAREHQVDLDSGVVIRMSGGRRAISRRSSWGVSPVRDATEILGSGSPSRAAARQSPRGAPGGCARRRRSAP